MSLLLFCFALIFFLGTRFKESLNSSNNSSESPSVSISFSASAIFKTSPPLVQYITSVRKCKDEQYNSPPFADTNIANL